MTRLAPWLAALGMALVGCGEEFAGGSGGSGLSSTGGSGHGGQPPGGGAGGTGTGLMGGGGSAGQAPDPWCSNGAQLTDEGLCVLAWGQDSAECPAVDDAYVYWTVSGAVMRIPKNGAPAPETYFDGGGNNECVVVYQQEVWWLDEFGQLGEGTTGGITYPRISLSPASQTSKLAVNDTHVYWTSSDADGAGRLGRVDKAGGAVEFVRLGLTGAAGVALDGQYVYWVDAAGAHRCPLGASCDDLQVEHIAPLNHGLPMADGELRLDEQSLFWNESHGIVTASKVNGSAGLLADTSEWTAGLQLVGTRVYFTSYTTPNGAVEWVNNSGGTRTVVAGGLDDPRGLAVDDASLYWVIDNNNPLPDSPTVMKARLPP